MRVKKGCWHYKLVQHKSFVSNPKPDNTDAMTYIGEVWIALFLFCLALPFAVVALVSIVSNNLGWFFASLTEFSIPFAIFISSPLWFTILLTVIEPFTKKRWRKLEVVD